MADAQLHDPELQAAAVIEVDPEQSLAYVIAAGVNRGMVDRLPDFLLQPVAAAPDGQQAAEPAAAASSHEPAGAAQQPAEPAAAETSQAEMSTSQADRAGDQSLTDYLFKSGNQGCPLPGRMVQDQAEHLAAMQGMSAEQLQKMQLIAILGCLAKISQIERAAHFAEKRQDATSSLPSERMRHLDMHQQNIDHCLRKHLADPDCKKKQEKLEQARHEKRKHQWDSLAASRQYGCLHQVLAAFQLFLPSFSEKVPCLRVTW